VILLDSHVWVWLANKSPRLSPSYLASLEEASDDLAISAISVWELANVVRKGRITLPTDYKTWVEDTIQDFRLTVLDVTQEIALETDSLPGTFHQDPADRMIVATARIHKAKLATFDSLITSYSHVELFRP